MREETRPRGDEAALFIEHHERLERAVARAVTAPHQVIEDACAFAWLQLLRTDPEREAIVAWLKVVAVREAIRLQTHKPTEPLETPDGEPTVEPEAAVDVETECAVREALAAVAALPARQRRVLGLHVGGLLVGRLCEPDHAENQGGEGEGRQKPPALLFGPASHP